MNVLFDVMPLAAPAIRRRSSVIGITTVEIVISAIRNAVVKFQSAHDSQTGRKTHASNLSYALYTVAEGASGAVLAFIVYICPFRWTVRTSSRSPREARTFETVVYVQPASLPFSRSPIYGFAKSAACTRSRLGVLVG